ncbi:MAG: TldD/PmbA family protein [Bacteroidales bacterium]|nr:TldD/PmbA family protein [Bacteroidales bacterium]
MIENYELELARLAMKLASEEGALKSRVCLSKSVSDIISTLDGQIDKVSHCLDRGLSLTLFVDGRFGTFSTNQLDEASLRAFVRSAVAMTRILAEDTLRDLPDPARCCKSAVNGDELGLYDVEYSKVTAKERRDLALKAAVTGRMPDTPEYRLISEEGEYSDSEFDAVTLDSNGLFCRHKETSFEYGVEVTVEATDGSKYSSFWWESSPSRSGLKLDKVGTTAICRAAAQIGAKPFAGGKYKMVVDSNVASKLVTPVLNALGGYSLQQGNSFMMDSLGHKVLGEGVTILDDCHLAGQSGSRLFDSEGVATLPGPVIENGVVREYFINTYISKKMGLAPTVEDCSRAHLMPWPKPGLSQADILAMCGDGILVTGFNGGNCNSATGDFSYGIEGFRFEKGVITGPVSGMLITGNFLELWKNLIAAGEDARPCAAKLIPTIAFDNVNFNG